MESTLTYNGTFNLILGCMYSGKSTELIRRYKRYSIATRKCLMVKYKGDIRYDDQMIATHDSIKIAGTVCQYLFEIDDQIAHFDVILIDEVQFYHDADIMIDKWVNMGKIVEACGLNGTFNRTEFPVISKLVPLVNDIVYLTAICKKNNNDASYSKIMRDIDINDKTIEIIGGINEYDAVDRQTYYGNKKFYTPELIKNFAVVYAGAKEKTIDVDNLMTKLNSIDLDKCDNLVSLVDGLI